MMLFAALCIGLGLLPRPLYAMLPFAVDFVPYTASHVVFHLQLLLFSGLAFFLMLGWLKRTLTITLDVDWFYRKAGLTLTRNADRSMEMAWLGIAQAAAQVGDSRRHSEHARAGGHSRPHLADRQHGVLDHHHASGLSSPVILNSGLRWRRGLRPASHSGEYPSQNHRNHAPPRKPAHCFWSLSTAEMRLTNKPQRFQ